MASHNSLMDPTRKKRGRPRRSWQDGITEAMKKRGKKMPRTRYFGEE
jgi:hypothetical protein